MIGKTVIAVWVMVLCTISPLYAQLVAPSILSIPQTSALAGSVYVYDVEATGTPTFSLLIGPDEMLIDPNTGLIQWETPKDGTHDVAVQAENQLGLDVQEFTIRIYETSEDPVIISDPPTQAFVGELYSYQIEALGEPPPDYKLEQAPEGMLLTKEPNGENVAQLSWVPQQTGDYSVVIIAEGLEGAQDRQEFTISVFDSNEPPSITSTPQTQALLNQQYTYQVIASNDPIFLLSQAPVGMFIDATSGLISWIPTDLGVYSVSVLVTNIFGSDSQEFSIEVVQGATAPMITSEPETEAVAGATYTYQMTATGNPAPFFRLGEQSPTDMEIDQESGLITWTPLEAGDHYVLTIAENEAGEDAQEFYITVNATYEPPEIRSTPIATGRVGEVYRYDVQATGDPLPTYTLITAPAGMSIKETSGVITWTPTTTGDFNVTVEATNPAAAVTQSYILTVEPPFEPPVITSMPPLQAFVAQPYTYDVEASGIPAPTFALTSAPEGMIIDQASGFIDWTPSVAGNFNITVQVNNSQGSFSQQFILNVGQQLAEPAFSSSPITSGTVNAAYRYDVEAAGNPAPTFSLSDAPPGMTINPTTGLINWTPTTTGNYAVDVKATNSQGEASQAYTIVVNKALTAPSISSFPVTQGFVDQPYSYDVEAIGNPAPQFSLLTAPGDMMIDPTTGVISWMPSVSGTFNVSIQASNSVGTDIQNLTITVSVGLSAPAITSTPVTQGIVGVPYRYDIKAVGNPAPSLTLKTAPSGMAIDAATGTVSWNPTTAGRFDVTIEAVNSQGTIEQSFTIVTERISGTAIVQQQAIEMIDATSLNFSAVVNPNGNATTVHFEYGETSVNETMAPATTEPLQGFDEVAVTASISGLKEATRYYYRVVAENDAGRIDGPTLIFTTYQSTYQIAADLPFSGRVDSLSYRLLSLPGNIDLDVSQTLSGIQDTDWGVYHDNGRPNNFFEKFDGGPRFHFKPGRGFWVLGKSRWTVQSQEINTVQLDEQGAFRIPLQPGWNIIGSPFDQPVSWQTILEANATVSPTAKLWAFENTFSESSTLNPYQGFYYFHDSGSSATLSIPFPGLLSQASKTALNQVAASKINPASIEPSLIIRATSSDQSQAAAEFMIAAAADAGKDALDQYAPRGFSSRLHLSIVPGFESVYGNLSLEAQPMLDDGVVFELQMQSKAGEPVELAVEGLAAYEGWDVYLVDRLSGRFVDLHATSNLTLYPETSASRYTVLIGSAGFIASQRTTLVPQTLRLAQNYPNPFNSSTTIEYSLPEPQHVELVVYDLLGRAVTTLVDSAQPAGLHQVKWDTNQTGTLSNGLYLVRLVTSSGETQVVRMMKVR